MCNPPSRNIHNGGEWGLVKSSGSNGWHEFYVLEGLWMYV